MTTEQKQATRSWLQAVVPVALALVAGLIAIGATRSDVGHNTDDIKELKETLRDSLEEFRRENREDHARIVDAIDRLKEAK